VQPDDVRVDFTAQDVFAELGATELGAALLRSAQLSVVAAKQAARIRELESQIPPAGKASAGE